MATDDFTSEEAPAFVLDRDSNGTTVIYAVDDEAFRVGCATEAVSKAVSLLAMLQREHRRPGAIEQAFSTVFENTMERVMDLLNSVNIGPDYDSMMESQDIANTIFGPDWLIGRLNANGSVVPVNEAEESNHV